MKTKDLLGAIWAGLGEQAQDAVIGEFGTVGKVVNVVRKSRRGEDIQADMAVIEAEFETVDDPETEPEEEVSFLDSLAHAFVPDLEAEDDVG